MTKRSAYQVLGIEPGATETEIRKAFRKKAFELHPDRNKAPDAEARFKEVNAAYQALLKGNKPAAAKSTVYEPPTDGDIFDLLYGALDKERQRRPKR